MTESWEGGSKKIPCGVIYDTGWKRGRKITKKKERNLYGEEEEKCERGEGRDVAWMKRG